MKAESLPIEPEDLSVEPSEKIYLLIDGHHGIYIPQIFYDGFYDDWNLDTFLTEEDDAIMKVGADHDLYWEIWEDILRNAYRVDEDGCTWTLMQDADLWEVRDDWEGYDEDYCP